MKFTSVVLFPLAAIVLGFGASALAGRQATLNPSARIALNLDGKWRVIVDPYDTGYYDYRLQPYELDPDSKKGFYLDRAPANPSELVEYDFDRSPLLAVPGDWNNQDPKLLLYEGAVWYRRLFDFQPAMDRRVFLHFGAANYQAEVYLNGKKIGEHLGGFTPFDVEITDTVKPQHNSLVVRVDNRRHREGVPTINTDWWNYGGLTRDVYVFTTPKTFIARHTVQLRPNDPTKIEIAVELAPAEPNQDVACEIPALHASGSARTGADGRATFTFDAPSSLQRWSPEHPKRYEVRFKSAMDQIVEQIGFRTIEVKGSEILLNGAPLFLRGACVHEENPLRGGRAWSREDDRLLLGWAKELHCNFLRLAHYPHNEHMAELADEMGLLLWEEIPVYWTIAWDNPDTLRNARAQLGELIERDRNRASVIIWSVANETPVSEARTKFLRQLIDDAHSLDPTRLVSAAMEVRKSTNNSPLASVDDPLGEYTDILSFNEYFGWYNGDLDAIPRVSWSIHYNKPVVISEFGADALQGLHGDATARFTEEYQAELYRRTLPMLQKISQLRGMSPWILVDFRSPRRVLANVQDGWNRKGLIGDNGVKKQAFSVLSDFYLQQAGKSER